MSLQWSPGDLRRQVLVVDQALDRAAINRRRLVEARVEVAERLRALAVPLALSAGVVAAAFAVGRYSAGGGRRRTRAQAKETETSSGRVRSALALAMSLAQILLRVRALLGSTDTAEAGVSALGKPQRRV